jgi:prepilin-type N-terminal cleavage/methylation domain-containing protein
MRVARDSRGFTLIELMVALAILAVGILGVATTFTNSGNLTTVAEKTEVATYQAQREAERIKALPYGDVALTSNTIPSGGGLGGGALAYKFGGPGGGTYDFSRSCSSPLTPTRCFTSSENLVTSADTAHSMSLSTTWQDNGGQRIGSGPRLSGTIYRFITFVKNDPECDSSCYSACAAAPASCYKRITVAVTLAKGPPNKPIVVTSLMEPRPLASQNPLRTQTCEDDTVSGNPQVPC